MCIYVSVIYILLDKSMWFLVIYTCRPIYIHRLCIYTHTCMCIMYVRALACVLAATMYVYVIYILYYAI